MRSPPTEVQDTTQPIPISNVTPIIFLSRSKYIFTFYYKTKLRGLQVVIHSGAQFIYVRYQLYKLVYDINLLQLLSEQYWPS